MTLVEPATDKGAKFRGLEVRERPPQSVREERPGEVGKLEGFAQAILGRHSPEDTQVDAVISFRLHRSEYTMPALTGGKAPLQACIGEHSMSNG